MEYQIDNFTISIDLSGNKLMSVVFFIDKVAKIVKNKIHIIKFDGVRYCERIVNLN